MTQRASVTLKIATSLDARIALSNGISQWITGPEARARSHEMRAAHDAILVGIGTVLADNPLLTARTVPLPERQPIRIVADSRLRTPPDGRLVQSAATGPIVLAHGAGVSALDDRFPRNVALWNVAGDDGKVSPREILRRARAEGLDRIFLEGGGKLAASFVAERLVDRIEWFRAPIILGGDGIPAIAALGLETLDRIDRWQLDQSERIGGDILERWILSS